MRFEKYINMSPAQLDAEIKKERGKIDKAKATIALLEKLKLVPDSASTEEGGAKYDG